MIDEIEHKLTTRHLRLDDYPVLYDLSVKAYKEVAAPWSLEQIDRLIKLFPEGQICIEDNGKAVAIALSLIIDFSLFRGSTLLLSDCWQWHLQIP